MLRAKKKLIFSFSHDAIAYSDIQVVRNEDELIRYRETSGFPNHDVKQRLKCLVYHCDS